MQDYIKDFIYPNIDIKKTGTWLRYICNAENISVKNIQEALHISSNQAIYDWFNGKTMPSINNFYALSKLLHIPLDKLIIELEEKTYYHLDDYHKYNFYMRVIEYNKRMFDVL